MSITCEADAGCSAHCANRDRPMPCSARLTRGHLFLGAAPGVGKTYAMLSAARAS
jgi:K+-sensing histidine kinase KdpD